MRKNFGKTMATLCLAYQQEASRELVELYWRYLSTYPEHVLFGAADRAISELKWFPKVAELVEFCEQIKAAELQREYNRRAQLPQLEECIDEDAIKGMLAEFREKMNWGKKTS